MPPSGHSSRRRHNVLNQYLHSSVTRLVNTTFWQIINRFCFWCQLAKLVHGATEWNDQLWGSGSQRSRSHEAGIWRLGGGIIIDPVGRSSRFSIYYIILYYIILYYIILYYIILYYIILYYIILYYIIFPLLIFCTCFYWRTNAADS